MKDTVYFADLKVFRWLGKVFVPALAIVLSVGLGVAVVEYGGVPHGWKRYGIVPIPGRQVLELPAGTVMLDHADDVEGCWDNTGHIKNANIYGMPRGTRIRITPVGKRQPLAVMAVPTWLYQNQTNCRGHEPFGRIEVPTTGRYLVETASAAHPAGAKTPTDDGAVGHPSATGPGIAFGRKPWTLFGSALLTGIVFSIIVFTLIAVPGRVLRDRIIGLRKAGAGGAAKTG